MKSLFITISFLFLSSVLLAQSPIKRDPNRDEQRARTASKYNTKSINSYQGIPLVDLSDMGANYFWGEHGVHKNQKKGLDMLLYSANKGCVEAYANLGDIYCDPESGCTDIKKGISYFEKGIQRGNNACINEMAMFYYTIQIDYVKAKHYFELGYKNGSSTSTYYLGQMYKKGEGGAQDIKQALSLFSQASQVGMLMADVELGNMYLFGNCVQKDYSKAYNYFYNAATKASIPTAVYNLARMTEEGLGCKQDKQRALEIYLSMQNAGFDVQEDISRIKGR